MQPITDPPSAAQMAQLLERMSNVIEDLKEIKLAQLDTNRQLTEMIGTQRDVAHLMDRVDALATVSTERTKTLASLEGRVKGLERWHKLVWGAILASGGVIGWGVNKIDYLYKMDNRISMLELMINSHGIERAMTPEPRAQEPRPQEPRK